MLKFIEHKSDGAMLQFIVNLLYLGMKSDNCLWAQANGTKQAVIDLLSTVSDSFIKTANDILLNGAITIDIDRRCLASHTKVHKNIEKYQDIIDVLRDTEYADEAYFSYVCKAHLLRLTEKFPLHEDLSVLR
jgi:hypothetical protein